MALLRICGQGVWRPRRAKRGGGAKASQTPEKGFRKIFPMPIGMGVYHALKDQLGRPDPDGKRAEAVKQADDYHCGISPPPRPVKPPAFPGIPRAIIESAEYPR